MVVSHHLVAGCLGARVAKLKVEAFGENSKAGKGKVEVNRLVQLILRGSRPSKWAAKAAWNPGTF